MTTKCTHKLTIRQRLYEDGWGVQFDFRAWFDQIRLAKRIQPIFGVTTTKEDAVLEFLDYELFPKKIRHARSQ
jgi:hypothetical protein